MVVANTATYTMAHTRGTGSLESEPYCWRSTSFNFKWPEVHAFFSSPHWKCKTEGSKYPIFEVQTSKKNEGMIDSQKATNVEYLDPLGKICRANSW